jgi:hypothetical protein
MGAPYTAETLQALSLLGPLLSEGYVLTPKGSCLWVEHPSSRTVYVSSSGIMSAEDPCEYVREAVAKR